MYLYVFVFIILSVMSIYMELFSMRVARINEQQTVAAGVMSTWHNGAYKYAKAHLSELTLNSAGCTFSPGFSPKCLSSGGVGLVLTVHDESGIQYLPSDFNKDYIGRQYPSYAYNNGTQSYIITYVMNDTTITAMGLSARQTMSQLLRSKLPAVSFGSVLNLKCNGAAGRRIKMRNFNDWGGTNVDYCYDVPSTIKIGSIGILSHL